MGQPLDVFEHLSISMIMVPGHSVKRVGLSPVVNMMARPPTRYRIGTKRRVKLTVVKGEEQP